MQPTISVIIPCYNSARYLPEAIASVRAQEYPELEIYVVDDGSTDGSVEVARSLGADIRVLTQPNQGPAAARNRALRECTGDYVAFLDSDDIWPAGVLAANARLLREDPEADAVLGYMHPFHDTAEGERAFSRQSMFIYVFGCGLYRRELFQRIGLIDESLRMGEDTDWFFRCWEQGVRFKFVSTVCVHYRRHAASLTHDATLQQKGFVKVLKKSLDRRRNGAFAPVTPMPQLGLREFFDNDVAQTGVES